VTLRGRIPARFAAAVALVTALTAGPAPAVTPVLWTTETLDEFERGKPDGVAVGPGGDLSLSPALTALNVPPLEKSADPFLWSLAVDSKGTLYAGGGKSGSVYRVPKDGAGSVWFETGDLAVHALAVDRGDVLYAGTLPQGKIYRITGEGKGEVYYQPEDRYIWDLAVGPKGELYAATGERGIIYRVTGPGKAEVFFDSQEFHIVALAVDPQGNVIAGSDGKGLLYRVTPQGKAAVLYDSPLREIAAVAVDPHGVIYAVAIGQEGEGAPIPLLQAPPMPAGKEQAPAGLPGQPPVVLPGIEDQQPAPSVTVTTVSAVVTPQGPPPKSEVYRIDPDGTVVTLWSSPSEVAYALALDSQGRPVIGTGEPGRIRVITGVQQSTLLARVPPSQVTALAAAGRQMFVASSNVGRLYSLDPAEGQSGTYISAAWDAQSVARWGRIGWRANLPTGSKVEVSTRTGNSAVPDDTWSDWSQAGTAADGSPIASPPGRFLQWRARLSRTSGGDGPVLSSVSVAYIQSNLPPVLKRLSLQPPGIIRERPQIPPDADPEQLAFTGIRVGPGGDGATASIPEKKIYVRGMRSLDWEAEDPNGDALAYDLWFRGEGEAVWKPLARGLREPYFAFDSMQLPDGLYKVRLDASDAPSNPGDKARTASLIGESFLVDNTPPAVAVAAHKGSKAGAITVEITATDAIGPIARADVSLDAARWIMVLPVDGVSDSRLETYSVPLEGLRPGEHTVIVRIADLLGNIGAGKATFTIE
jgi:sugar lactone lactonase YvrE